MMRDGQGALRGGTSAGTRMRRTSAAAILLVLAVVLTGWTGAAEAKPKARPQAKLTAPEAAPKLEAKAIDILKAASDRLAAAQSMTFSAVVSYENPSRYGPPLVYTTRSEVTVQRPDKVRVITLADGPASEFYYDGKAMVAFEPAANLVAVADAPPTIDAMLKAAYDSAAIYFPFSDLIVADPYQDIADGLRLAFYIGQSQVVGGTTTDMVAYASDDVFVQAWIGSDDKLPRRVRAVYRHDPTQLRHQMDLSNWQLDQPVAAESFASTHAATASRIEFSRPDPVVPPGAKPPAKRRHAAKAPPPAAQQ
jgi:hypothetical protein